MLRALGRPVLKLFCQRKELQMKTKVLYYDDEIERPGRDAQKIKELLDTPGEFEIDLRFPPQRVSDLPTDVPDVLLVDFEMRTAPKEGEAVNYYGSTLA